MRKSMIRYMKGDATCPQAKGQKVIVHVCNDAGKWGKGFVMAVSKRWPKTREEYLSWYKDGKNFTLGAVQLVEAQADITVANIVGQKGTKSGSKGNPVRYDAIKAGLQGVAKHFKGKDVSIHMPRIGCGLAGGKWERIEPIIKETLGEFEVTVYDYDD
jgi:O-acetyl-ADP-ribose deacetylase (regulator of RNase III)